MIFASAARVREFSWIFLFRKPLNAPRVFSPAVSIASRDDHRKRGEGEGRLHRIRRLGEGKKNKGSGCKKKKS